MLKLYERKISESISWEDQPESLKLILKVVDLLKSLLWAKNAYRGWGGSAGRLQHSLAETRLVPSERSVPRRSETFPEGMVLSVFLCSSVLSKNVPVPSCHWVILVSVTVEGTRARKGSPAIHIPDGILLLFEFCNIPSVDRASLKVKACVCHRCVTYLGMLRLPNRSLGRW